MVSDINTKNREQPKPRLQLKRKGRLRSRILAVNLIAPVVLLIGFFYLGQYREELLQAEQDRLTAQTQVFASALSQGAFSAVYQNLNKNETFFQTSHLSENQNVILLPSAARLMVRTMADVSGLRLQMQDEHGTIIADSHQYFTSGLESSQILVETIPSTEDISSPVHRRIFEFLTGLGDDFTLHVKTDLLRSSMILGTLTVISNGDTVRESLIRVQKNILGVFAFVLGLTFLLSFFLAQRIGRPLQDLADAADKARDHKGMSIAIPDFGHRQDEIGSLSLALRDMTEALQERMDSIESFAADVAHELKNPLTSLRSAIETATRVHKKEDLEKLTALMQHDIRRLDRLITDISKASRLDAALYRDEKISFDLKELIKNVVSAHQHVLQERQSSISIHFHHTEDNQFIILGNEDRITQVLDNLITNALTFSPENGTVTLSLKQDYDIIILTVSDEGTGIPEGKFETIFERFYTERPQTEDYGNHSGLGLAICRQIILYHNGTIQAANNIDSTGAVFEIRLPKMTQ